MKEQIISERANIIANLRQLVQSLVELNMRAKTHVSSNKADIKKLRKDNKELEKMKIRLFARFVYRKGHLPFEQKRMVRLHYRVQQARSTRERTCRLC